MIRRKSVYAFGREDAADAVVAEIAAAVAQVLREHGQVMVTVEPYVVADTAQAQRRLERQAQAAEDATFMEEIVTHNLAMTASAFAGRVGVTPPTVAKIRRGMLSITGRTAKKILAAHAQGKIRLTEAQKDRLANFARRET